MVCKSTFTKPTLRRRRMAGMLLAEALVTVVVVGILLLTLVMFMIFSTRSFTTMYNYVDLDDRNRVVMDQLTRDIRQCNRIVSCTTAQLVLETDDPPVLLSYTFKPAVADNPSDNVGGLLMRRRGEAPSKVILTGCDRFSFEMCKRNPMSGSYGVYPTSDPSIAKVLNVSWLCSRKIFGFKQNTESVQTARIVIRKQGT